MGKKLKKQKKKLGKKVLAGKLTVEEARATIGRRVVQKSARISDGLTDYGRARIKAQREEAEAVFKATADAHARNMGEREEAVMYSVAGDSLSEAMWAFAALRTAREAERMVNKSMTPPAPKTIMFQGKSYEIGPDGSARIPASDYGRKY